MDPDELSTASQKFEACMSCRAMTPKKGPTAPENNPASTPEMESHFSARRHEAGTVGRSKVGSEDMAGRPLFPSGAGLQPHGPCPVLYFHLLTL